MQAEHLPTYELNVLSTPARSVTSRGAAAGRLGASLSLSTANKLLKLVHCRRCCKVAAAHLLSVKGMGDELQDLKGPASALAKFFFFSVALVAIPLGAVQLTLAGFLDGADTELFCACSQLQTAVISLILCRWI